MRLLSVLLLAACQHAKPGFIRIDSLGVDVQAPPDSDYAEIDIDRADISWGRCLLQVAVAPDDEPGRKIVGTLPLTCHVFGEGCGSQCGEIRPIPGGPAEERYPTEPPAIQLTSAWSDRGADRAGLFVWRDGTVQFYGAKCSGYRGRRGSLPAARATALVDALGGLLPDHADDRADARCRHEINRLTVRSMAQRNSIKWHCQPDDLTRRALALVDKAVGANPCLRR